MTVSRPFLGSVWLYVSWFQQRASDCGYKLDSMLHITTVKENNYCEIIYRSWVRIPATPFLRFIIMDSALRITMVELKLVVILSVLFNI